MLYAWGPPVPRLSELALYYFIFQLKKAELNITKNDLCFQFLSALQVTKIIGKILSDAPLWFIVTTLFLILSGPEVVTITP